MGMNQQKNTLPSPKVIVLTTAMLAAAIYFMNLPKARAQTQFERIEVPVGHVFVPAVGYDDNDNIEIMFDGILPNGCYAVSDYHADVDQNSKQIVPHLLPIERIVCVRMKYISLILLHRLYRIH